MISDILRSLSEPTRLSIVELLRDGPRSVNEIAERLALNQPQASKHLRALKASGLVDVIPIAQQRVYELRPEGLLELSHWVDRYRAIWEQRFDRMDRFFAKTHASENARKRSGDQSHE